VAQITLAGPERRLAPPPAKTMRGSLPGAVLHPEEVEITEPKWR
jgi:hypothetical protein